MDGLITQVSASGILIVLVLREVFTFMNKKKMNGYSPLETAKKVNETSLNVRDMCNGMSNLVEIDKETGKQVRDIWYDRKALARTTEKLYTAVDNLTLSINKNSEITKKVYDAFEKKNAN